MSDTTPRDIEATFRRFLLYIFIGVGLLVVLKTVLPGIVEEIQYSATRGRERAEYELAGQFLEGSALADLSKSYELVMKKIGPSVVHIVTSGQAIRGENGFGIPSLLPREQRGMGAGIVVDSAGYVLTNFHVVVDSDDIQVTLADDRTQPATVVGIDSEADLAILKIGEENLTPVDWSDSDEVEEGALVWAVGSPYGLNKTISSGIISATNRSRLSGRTNQLLLQTDVPLNPGNSGGPLVDAMGRVVGINTAIHGPEYRGISFAIPSRVARTSYQRMRNSTYPTRGYLGVGMDPISAEQAAEIGLERRSAVLVREVRTSVGNPTPAQDAGVRAGDIVVGWNDQVVESPEQLSSLVAASAVGTTAKLSIVRAGNSMTLNIEVRSRPLQMK
jgi:S1-C subfamily serine protease